MKVKCHKTCGQILTVTQFTGCLIAPILLEESLHVSEHAYVKAVHYDNLNVFILLDYCSGDSVTASTTSFKDKP